MPVKLVSQNKMALFPGVAVPKSFIEDLINKNQTNTKKKKKGDTPSTPPHNMGKDDARSCWFPYSELEQLFNDNGLTPNSTTNEKMKYGIRIYLGMHDENHDLHKPPNGIPLPKKSYDEQHTVILVVTKKDSQNLNADQLIEDKNSLSYGGQGLDIGSLCPPDCKDGQTW